MNPGPSPLGPDGRDHFANTINFTRIINSCSFLHARDRGTFGSIPHIARPQIAEYVIFSRLRCTAAQGRGWTESLRRVYIRVIASSCFFKDLQLLSLLRVIIMSSLMHLWFAAREDNQGSEGPYNYVPTQWICALFVSLFSVTTIIHLTQALNYRLWFLLPTAVLAGLGEIIGWAARLWSSKNPTLLDPFLMQISTTIIAPTPLVAANFVILGQLITLLGPKYSRLSPRWYTIVFVTCDVAALVVQAVGGANASLAVQNNRDPGPGGNIMLAGIIIQLVAIAIYMVLAAEFVIRFLINKPVRRAEGGAYEGTHQLDYKTKLMLVGLVFSSTVIFIRSIYRTIELSNGWSGRIIATQVYFNVLDGGMITLAFYCLNVFHPGCLLGPGKEWKRTKTMAETIKVNVAEKKGGDESYTPSTV